MMIERKENKYYHLLIVEDDEESVSLLKYFLAPEGYTILEANNGQDALDLIEKTPPDLIILDVMLPEVDGFTICKTLKANKRTRHIPVIMLTALKELKDKIKGLEAGADDFITKPFDSLEMIARVRSLLKAKSYYDQILIQNEKLEKEEELKKELIHLIVHDMKNPLFVIQGNLQMMDMDEQLKAPPVRKYINRIEKSSKNLLRMILNLLDISRFENDTIELRPVKVDLNIFLKLQVDRLIKQNSEDIDVQFNGADEAVPISLDTEIFARVLDNLFAFIQDNTDSGGHCTINLQAIKGKIKIQLNHSGTPIPEEFQDKIFEKYAQSELKKAGFKLARGLGLIFCKIALNAMGGDIELQKISKGNTFIISLNGENDAKN